MAAIDIRAIDAHETHLLRHELLRPTQTLSDMAYPGDEDAVHYGAISTGRVVGIASIYPGDGRSWRLRAMAVCPEVRRSGVGTALLDRCLATARQRGAGEVWCNARTPAVDFYARAGFVTEGDEFDIPHAGPHFVMRLRFS